MAPNAPIGARPHHEANDGEHHLGRDVDQIDQRRSAFAKLHQREAA
ncbi:hypothetical protein ACVWXO_009197 [Bradyrhizobium sp. LM2.7]